MTQQELDDLYQYLNEDGKKFDQVITERGGTDVVSFDVCEDCDVGGTIGLESLFDMLRSYNFTVLQDPRWDLDCGDIGWVIFPPRT